MAVHSALTAAHRDVETLWVGGEGGMETGLVERAGIPFKAIPAAGLHGVSLKHLPGNVSQLVQGVLASRRILEEFDPDVLFFTGGYVAVPMAFAGRKRPSLLYVPDIEPGLALKTLARFANRIALTADDSCRFFPGSSKTIVTGYPVRPGLAKPKKADVLKQFGLQNDLPVLLVFGGSKGARSINQALLEALPALLQRIQVLHISGELDWPTVEQVQKSLSGEYASRYHAFSYLHEKMGMALAAADLVLARSGASTLGEFPLFELPAVLVPYPHAWRYQKINADYLARHNAAIVIEDAKLNSGLFMTIEMLLENPEKLEVMRQAMQSLSVPDAAAKIAAQLRELVGEKHD